MVGARAVRDHDLRRELVVALPIIAVSREQGRMRTLRRIAFIPHDGRLRGPGLRPAALGSRLILLRTCLGGPGRRPGAGPRWFGTEWTELVAHGVRYADTCGWPATSSSARSGIRQLVRARRRVSPLIRWLARHRLGMRISARRPPGGTDRYPMTLVSGGIEARASLRVGLGRLPSGSG